MIQIRYPCPIMEGRFKTVQVTPNSTGLVATERRFPLNTSHHGPSGRDNDSKGRFLSSAGASPNHSIVLAAKGGRSGAVGWAMDVKPGSEDEREALKLCNPSDPRFSSGPPVDLPQECQPRHAAHHYYWWFRPESRAAKTWRLAVTVQSQGADGALSGRAGCL